MAIPGFSISLPPCDLKNRPPERIAAWGAVLLLCLAIALPSIAQEKDAAAARELETFKAWLQEKRPGYGCDEGPARFQNAAVDAAYPGRRFYYVLTYTRGIPPPFKNSLSLVADVDGQGTVQRLDSSSLETYRRGLKRVKATADARLAATAVLILTLGDPGQRRFPIKAEFVRVKKNRDGWTCTYPHDPNHLSEVRFDRRGLLTAIHCMPPPVG